MKTIKKTVELKGYRDGLHLIIDPQMPINQIESAIIKRLANIGDSLSGMQINLDIGGRELEKEELYNLQKLLDEQYRLKIKKVNGNFQPEDISSSTKEDLEIRAAPAIHGQKEEMLINEDIESTEKTERTKLVRQTLRSGQKAKFLEGNIVIIGDVNPGAEVIASGDVVVLGNLRGMAHAGALGDCSAVIIALKMEPTQLRIARLINRPPSNRIEDKDKPEIAKIEDNIIKVSLYNKKLPLFSF